MKTLLMIGLLFGMTVKAHAAASYMGTDDQPVSILPGNNQIGGVKITNGVSTMTVNGDGSINVVSNVVPSTNSIRGADGSVVTTNIAGSTVALVTNNLGRANLFGKSLVYKSSDAMVVGGALTLTGVANSVDLQSITNDCTFNISGGDPINVAKNTAESFPFDYTATNLTVNLTAKSSGATCKARIVGAN